MSPKPGLGVWPSIVLALLIVGLQVSFFTPHYRGLASFPHDFPVDYYGWTAYWQSSVIAGEWPHWVPFQAMGYPFASNPQTGIFYPPFWLFVFFEIPYTLRAANIFQALHIAGGALGFYLLVRALLRSPWVAVVGGVTFHLFGGLFTNAEHADIVRGYCLLPWLLWSCLLRVPGIEDTVKREVRGGWLARRNLLLPVTVFFFLTGSYPGVAFAGLWMAAIFLLAQLLVRARTTPWKGQRLRATGLFAAGLLGTGVICSSVFLLPAGYLSRFLVRYFPSFSDLDRMRFFLAPVDLLQLLFPTLVVNSVWRPYYGNEGSMLGMQIPVALLLFVGFLGRERLSRLIPFIATFPFVLVMCLAGAVPLRWLLTTLLPPLGLSRFPAGDYRFYIWLVVVLACLFGLDEFLRRTQSSRSLRPLVPMISALAAFALLAWLVDRYAVAAGRQADFRHVVRVQGIALAGLLVVATLKIRRNLPAGVFAILLCGLATVSVHRMYSAMGFHWYGPNAEYVIYLSRDLPLSGPDGLTAAGIFSRAPGPRPPRIESASDDTRWRGYLTGEYLTANSGGAETIWHQRITANPPLKAYLMRGSELRSWSCSRVNCNSQAPVQLDIDAFDGALLSFETLNYARNTVTYRVNLREPALVVENEIGAPGWTGVAREQPVELREVNGALRGWVLQPGNYELTVQYDTPLLPAARLLSMAGLGLWLFLAAFASRVEAAPSTVISGK